MVIYGKNIWPGHKNWHSKNNFCDLFLLMDFFFKFKLILSRTWQAYKDSTSWRWIPTKIHFPSKSKYDWSGIDGDLTTRIGLRIYIHDSDSCVSCSNNDFDRQSNIHYIKHFVVNEYLAIALTAFHRWIVIQQQKCSFPISIALNQNDKLLKCFKNAY